MSNFDDHKSEDKKSLEKAEIQEIESRIASLGKKGIKKALRDLESAVDNHNRYAPQYLARLYEKGAYVGKDLFKSENYYRIACNWGVADQEIYWKFITGEMKTEEHFEFEVRISDSASGIEIVTLGLIEEDIGGVKISGCLSTIILRPGKEVMKNFIKANPVAGHLTRAYLEKHDSKDYSSLVEKYKSEIDEI